MHWGVILLLVWLSACILPCSFPALAQQEPGEDLIRSMSKAEVQSYFQDKIRCIPRDYKGLLKLDLSPEDQLAAKLYAIYVFDIYNDSPITIEDSFSLIVYLIDNNDEVYAISDASVLGLAPLAQEAINVDRLPLKAGQSMKLDVPIEAKDIRKLRRWSWQWEVVGGFGNINAEGRYQFYAEGPRTESQEFSLRKPTTLSIALGSMLASDLAPVLMGAIILIIVILILVSIRSLLSLAKGLPTRGDSEPERVFRTIEAYHLEHLKQYRISSVLASTALLGGLAVVILGIFYVLDNKIIVGVLSSTVGVVSSFLSVIFFRNLILHMNMMRLSHNKLIAGQFLSQARAVADAMGVKERQSALKAFFDKLMTLASQLMDEDQLRPSIEPPSQETLTKK
jgi:hypothetical protein